MEFKTLTNIQSAFDRIRLVVVLVLAGNTLLTAVALWRSYDFAERQRQKIYVLDQGKSLMLALAQDAAQNRPVEAREHVRRFHELFFSLAPDKEAIESNVARALALADGSAYAYYRNLAERGYYNRIIAGDIIQRIEVDSIACDFDSYPYRVVTYARQHIVRASNRTLRSLVTHCTLRNTQRSDSNPQGFLIENFIVTENKDLTNHEK